MTGPAKHKHIEAFCLMQYRDTVNGQIELLWNSRDGVTPFIITSRNGNEAVHINFREDVYAPHYVPQPGMRMFVDASPKHAHIQESARDYVDRFWSAEMAATLQIETKDEAVEFFVAEWTKPGSPTVIEAEP